MTLLLETNHERAVDLNSDLGEGFGTWSLGDDTAMLEIVTSANVACGFHAGDAMTMLQTCRSAALRDVTVGAHVGYRDLVGFGRRYLDMTYRELLPEVLYQLGALDGIARSAGTRVAYVKPHGALYNALDRNKAQASALLDAIQIFDATLPVVGLAGSSWLATAKDAGFTTVSEVFADRAYLPNGSLTPRNRPGAVLQDHNEIARRCIDMVCHGQVAAVNGSMIPVKADSICVHGDTVGSVEIAAALASALHNANISLASFVS